MELSPDLHQNTFEKAAAAMLETLLARKGVLTLGGSPGSGKSVFSEQIKAVIECFPSHSVTIEDIDSPKNRPNAGHPLEDSTEKWRNLSNSYATALKQDGLVIASATFLLPATRHVFAKIAADHGAAFMGIWLNIDEETLIRSASGRHNHPDSAHDAADRIAAWQRSFNENGGIAAVKADNWHVLDRSMTDGLTQLMAKQTGACK